MKDSNRKRITVLFVMFSLITLSMAVSSIFNEKEIFFSANTIDYSNWMSTLDNNRLLREISSPMAHDTINMGG